MPDVRMIGLQPDEVAWVRILIDLLRHPDPIVGEVAKEALRYLVGVATRADESKVAG